MDSRFQQHAIDGVKSREQLVGFHFIKHRHTRILCVSDGCLSGIPIPPHQQEMPEKGGKADGIRKNRPRNRPNAVQY